VALVNISVIIPCYNTEQRLLLGCINSVIFQTYKDIEIIIVDDGSSVKYREVYDRIKQLDSRLNIIFKDNGGVSSARNLGVRNSKGRYIVFVDSDDELTSFFLQEAFEIIENENADIVYGCNIHIQDRENIEKIGELSDNDIECLYGEEIQNLKPYMLGEHLRFKNSLYIGRGPWARILKRQIAANVSFDTELAICEDIVWNLQVIDKCNKVCYVKRPWYIYNNLNLDSAVRKSNPKAIEQAESGLLKVKHILDLKNDKQYKAFCDRCLEDIYRIYSCTTKEDEKRIEDKFYNDFLWRTITERRYWNMSAMKRKIKIILYKLKMIRLIKLYWLCKN